MDTFITLLFSGLTLGAIYTLVSLGIVVLQKATGVINAAQFGLVALGAYLAFWASTDLGLPLVLASVLAIAILAVIGVVLERLTYAPLRSKPIDSVFLATLAGGFAMVGLIVLWYNADPRGLHSPLGYGTVSILGGTVPKHSLLVLAVSLLAVLGLSLAFNRTSFGRQVRALAADRNTARLYGVAANKLSIAAFALASAMAGLAGVLLGPIAALTPEMGLAPMLFAFGAAIIAGFGRLWGVVGGAMLLGLVEQLAAGYIAPDFRQAYPFVAILLILALRPEGLFGGESSVRL